MQDIIRKEINKKSEATNESKATNRSEATNESKATNWSKATNESKATNWSKAINKSQIISHCTALHNCVLCYELRAKENYLFNKKSTDDRIKEVKQILYDNGINKLSPIRHKVSYETTLDWSKVQPDLIEEVNMFDNMPDGLEDAIKSLPEYNEKVWNKIKSGENK